MIKIFSLNIVIKVISILAISSVMINCGALQRGQQLGGGGDGSAQSLETVPKVQYDQLVVKYEALLKATREKNDEGEVVVDAEASNLNAKKKDEAQYPSSEKLSALKDDLLKSQEGNNVELHETVDLFSDGKQADKKIVPAIGMDDVTIETQIIQLRKALKLVEQKKFNQAIGHLKDLENSPIMQIKVRAKFQIGEMLFFQQEYDLALQVYEEIVSNYAFSAIVLKTLDRLIECSNKLKLGKKQEQYYSVLTKFFEAS